VYNGVPRVCITGYTSGCVQWWCIPGYTTGCVESVPVCAESSLPFVHRLRRELSPLCTPSAQSVSPYVHRLRRVCVPHVHRLRRVCTRPPVCEECTPSSRLRRVYYRPPFCEESSLPCVRRGTCGMCTTVLMRDVHNGDHAGCA